jgi:hypothetical protein
MVEQEDNDLAISTPEGAKASPKSGTAPCQDSNRATTSNPRKRMGTPTSYFAPDYVPRPGRRNLQRTMAYFKIL